MGWLIAILLVGCVAAAMKSSSAAQHNRADRAPRELRQKLDENGQPLYNQWGEPVLEDDGFRETPQHPVAWGSLAVLLGGGAALFALVAFIISWATSL
ncbi:hypothetical protein [Bifidobacterium castoris]|uniref:Uncharacterized protein n=1 Tax=Bifidobacterium castoris TaxID=2306972 RepID=A0A430FAJ3_9BIFI|nr:hypothetical protein [Bifidobacterium castoris]RSX49854.1 hypothetical protein D2E22_0315 [Bifidobacterium castoris]